LTKRVLVSWSSGKDSAWLLHVLRQQADVELVALVTTYNEAADRVAMHGVRLELVRAQAGAVGLDLWAVPLPHPCSNEEYELRMQRLLRRARQMNVTHFAFGDLYLEDVREYRIRQLAGTGIEPMFPVWCGEHGTKSLAKRMVDAGFRAIVTCVDLARLPAEFAGRVYDQKMLSELPEAIDRCGERGEFHTFCYAGPTFPNTIQVKPGRRVTRDGFTFVDLTLP